MLSTMSPNFTVFIMTHLNPKGKLPPLQQIICEKLCKYQLFISMRKIF